MKYRDVLFHAFFQVKSAKEAARRKAESEHNESERERLKQLNLKNKAAKEGEPRAHKNIRIKNTAPIDIY